MALAGCRQEHLVRGRRQRRGLAVQSPLVEHDAEILDENVHRARHRRVVMHHLRPAIAPHPGVAGGNGDDLVHGLQRQPRSLGDVHRFRGRRDVHAAQELVDHLRRRAQAGLLTHMEDALGGGLQHRQRALQVGLRAGTHDRQRRVARANHAARDRRVEHRQAAVGQACRQARRLGRWLGACSHDERVPRQRFFGATPAIGIAEQHAFGLIAVHDHQPQQVNVSRHVGQRLGDFAARGSQIRQRLRLQVEAAHRVARLDDVGRHGLTHRAQTNDADAHRVVLIP